MDIAEIFLIYKNNSMRRLSLDDILMSTGISHEQLRQYCADNGEEMPPITPGLIYEVQESFEGSRTELSRRFNLSYLELNNCLYCDRKTIARYSQLAKAAALRNAGSTEEDLVAMDLPTDKTLMSAEVTLRRAKGESIKQLAHVYGCSVSRISQLDQNSKKKVWLSDETKQAIKDDTTSTATQLAKKHRVTVNTVYVIKRGTPCKSL